MHDLLCYNIQDMILLETSSRSEQLHKCNFEKKDYLNTDIESGCKLKHLSKGKIDLNCTKFWEFIL